MGPKKEKGEPPKVNKKNQKEKLEKKLDENTFGMKNKNKSSKVKAFIETATKSLKHGTLYTDGEKAKQAKTALKQAKLLQEEELRLLFNDAISGQFGKSKAQKAADSKNLGIDTQKKEVQDILDTISTDSESDDSDDDDDYNRKNVVFTSADDDAAETEAVEVFREKTLEDIIEEQRAKLLSENKAGTPVTAESFAKWRAAKLLKRQAEAEAKLKAEQTKKKGGKGLSVLSGKELFNYNASLFVDDDAAISATEEKAMNAETQVVNDKEDEKSKYERERALADQEQLLEIFRLEDEARKLKLQQWKDLCEYTYRAARTASESKAFVFPFCNTTINGYVFAVDEEEMLDLFEDEEEDETDDDEEEDEEEEN